MLFSELNIGPRVRLPIFRNDYEQDEEQMNRHLPESEWLRNLPAEA